MVDEAQIPVELQLENQKILKCQVEIQKHLQSAEHDCTTLEDFKGAIQLARKELGVLRILINHFILLAEEWKYEVQFNDSLKSIVAEHLNQLRGLQISLQQAFVGGEDRIGKMLRSNLLFTEGHHGVGIRQRKADKVHMASKASDITRSLISIARTMDAQVRQSEESNALLQDSSEVILKTHDEYKGLAGIISSSRKLINKYNRRELTDTLLIFLGLVFFFSTVVYIISKRL